jgi:hypothetical protein
LIRKVGRKAWAPPICSNGYWWSLKRSASRADSSMYSSRSHDSLASSPSASRSKPDCISATEAAIQASWRAAASRDMSSSSP